MQQYQAFSYKRFLSLCFLSLIFCGSLFTHSVLAADIAGRIIMARGDVQAITNKGTIRQLKRRDSIYSHEIIKTGIDSKVQIRFIDNALLALKAESELNIKAYVYSEVDDKDNQVLMELVAGGFRTLTGKIGKGNKEAYKVNTPVASIGIRGTLYDVQISFDKIIAGVWKGGISLDTAQGQFDLGLNSNFDFGEISAGGVFTGLLTPPETFSPPTPQTKGDASTENDKANNSTQEFSSNDNKQTPNETAQAEPRPATNTIPSPFEKEGRPDETVKDSDSFTTAETDTTDPDSETDPTIPDSDDPDIQTPSISPDIRLTNSERNQLIAENTLAILIGNNNSNLSIALNTNGTGEVFFLAPNVAADGTQSYETIRRGDAPEADFSNSQPWSDQVSWGIWQGSSENPIQRFTEFNNNQDFIPLEKNLFYTLVQPATLAELNTGIVDGTMTFSSSDIDLSGTGKTDFIASSNLGNVINVNAQFDLSASSGNYSISNIYLDVDIDTDNDIRVDQTWNMSASTGQINGASINVDNLVGQLTNITSESQSQASGTINGLLLAPRPGSTAIDTFTGGFDISTTDGANNAAGVIILQIGQSIGQ
ncbi:MAG: FecR family protein [Oleispira sp.]